MFIAIETLMSKYIRKLKEQLETGTILYQKLQHQQVFWHSLQMESESWKPTILTILITKNSR